jgi:hypothetical protein
MPFRVHSRNFTPLILLILGGLSSIGCGPARTGPIKPAAPFTAEERREFEKRANASLTQEREQKKQERVQPIVPEPVP